MFHQVPAQPNTGLVRAAFAHFDEEPDTGRGAGAVRGGGAVEGGREREGERERDGGGGMVEQGGKGRLQQMQFSLVPEVIVGRGEGAGTYGEYMYVIYIYK